MTVAAIETGKLDIGRVIQGTFGVIGRNFVTFSAMGLLFYGLPLMAFSIVQQSLGVTTPTFNLQTILWSITGGLVMIVTSAILQGALIHATVQDMNGAKPALGESLATGLRAFLPLLGVSILFGLSAGLGFMLLIVPGIMIVCAWAVAVPALIADRTGVSGAFGRSATLTRGNRWRIFGLALITYVVAIVMSLVLLQLSGINAFAQPDAASIQAAQAGALSPVALILNLVTNVLTSVISSTGIAVLYVELRRNHEGGGAKWLSEIFS